MRWINLCINKWLIYILWIGLFASPHLKAQLTFDVDCREAATIFDIMDNVALWRAGGGSDLHYRPYWDKQFSPLPQDETFFKKYAHLRKKYFIESADAAGNTLFLPQSFLEEDPIASRFYSSSTLEDALKKLATILDPEEISFLRRFYKHFEPRYATLIKGKLAFPSAIQNERKKLTNPRVILLQLEEALLRI